ncbi:peptidase M4 [Rhodanobacter glycinis]|uniref:Peptidase M4 n=1 Tax=Rhodanobacter glycinis TaxID=582702 RepID=A0A502FA30_9GAMM|nr:PepSY domain-containing protein [Rhodanobacter glycinis]TPG07339.1 peptidase M4 [Rhodanobacter glycinis]TPG46181.1 peptidase M4 [Rhodanobacter glycinis]
MKKSLAILAVVALAATTFAATAATPSALVKQAKVKMPEAREIALKAYPGKIVKEELEQEKGGSGLRYSFDIANGKVTHEVGVDAKTGELLENSVEGADND